MPNVYYFLGILVPILGIFVTVIIVLIKFNRNSVTKDDLRAVKDDLSNNIDALRSEMNRWFEEAVDDREKIRTEAAADRRQMREGFAKAETDREKIQDEAATDRRQIREEMREGFVKAETDREKIQDEAATDRRQIREEMREGFAKAETDREKIQDGAAADRRQIRTEVMNARQAIEGEMSRQNQNYIEHLVYHNTRKPKPESEEEDST